MSDRTTGAGLLRAAGDLLLGAVCPGCDRPGFGLCPSCRHHVARQPVRATAPDPCPAGFPVTVAAGPYDTMMRSLVSALKERQALALTPVLGDRLALAVARLLTLEQQSVRLSEVDPHTALVLVPLPSTPRVVRQRGYDATAALARRAAHRLRRSGLARVGVQRWIRPGRAVLDQAGLTAADRQQNLAGALRGHTSSGPTWWRPDLRTSPAIIVDDVVTTGASLTEAARALRSVGVDVVGAAVVAATQRRRATRRTRSYDH